MDTKHRLYQLTQFDRKVAGNNTKRIAGVDEAGRGPLAGPVVAAAVILPQDVSVLTGVDDSKRLSPSQREELYLKITQLAIAVGIGVVNAQKIDKINILQATFQAMRLAIQRLPISPEHILVDGRKIPKVNIPQTAIVNGDTLSLAIASASIVAKVIRDRIMVCLDRLYPQYGFAQHKGYTTKAHINALNKYGPCKIHRKSFKPVQNRLITEASEDFMVFCKGISQSENITTLRAIAQSIMHAQEYLNPQEFNQLKMLVHKKQNRLTQLYEMDKTQRYR